jgi:two-component system response regulator FixJ
VTSRVIAVLDDERSMRQSLQRLLRVHGYQVALFENGPALLAARVAQPWGCILLDLNMPDMDGFTVLQKLTAQPAHPPIVVITGQNPIDCTPKVERLGACACLAKPVDQDALMETIRDALGSPPPGIRFR